MGISPVTLSLSSSAKYVQLLVQQTDKDVYYSTKILSLVLVKLVGTFIQSNTYVHCYHSKWLIFTALAWFHALCITSIPKLCIITAMKQQKTSAIIWLHLQSTQLQQPYGYGQEMYIEFCNGQLNTQHQLYYEYHASNS